MVELTVVCILTVVAFALAFAGVRGVLSRPIEDERLERAARALGDGVARFVRRQHTIVATLCAVLAALSLVTHGVAYQVGGPPFGWARARGVTLGLSICMGAALSLLVAWAGGRGGVLASVRVAVASRRSIDEALRQGLRGGAVPIVFAEALACFVLAVGVLSLGMLGGGFRNGTGAGLAEVLRAPMTLGGLALGASLVALLDVVAAGLFAGVADVGADAAGQLEAGLHEDSVENPATLADVVGDQVGDAAPIATSAWASTLFELVASMLVAAILFSENESLPSATALVLSPLVIRAMGVVVTWGGVLVVRTSDTETPATALQRGLVVTSVLVAVAGIGTMTWLVAPHARLLGAAVLLGVGVNVALYGLAQLFAEARSASVRGVADGARIGAALTTHRGLVVGVDATLVQVVLFAGAVYAASRLGMATELKRGGWLGIVLFLSGLHGAGGYVRALASLGAAADGAAGLIKASLGGDRPDVHARARALSTVGATMKGYRRVTATLSSVTATGLVALAISSSFDARQSGVHGTPGVGAAFGAFAGGVLVVGFGRTVLGAFVVSLRELVEELRHRVRLQRQGFVSGEVSVAASTSGFSDEHAACLEVVSRAALRRMLVPSAVAALSPLLLGLGLRLSATGDSVRQSADAVLALVIVATIVGGVGSLLFANAGSAWDTAKRYIETGAHGGRYGRSPEHARAGTPEGSSSLERVDATDLGETNSTALNPTFAAALVGDTIGDPLKKAVGSTLLALLETLALLALAFHLFFL